MRRIPLLEGDNDERPDPLRPRLGGVYRRGGDLPRPGDGTVPSGHGKRWPLASDRGETIISAAIVYPLVFLAVLIVIQVAIYAFAAEGARHAASAGVEATQAQGATEQMGARATRGYLDQVGGLTVDSVEVIRQAGQVTVSVEGTSLALVPLWSPVIEVTSTGPVEQWSTS